MSLAESLQSRGIRCAIFDKDDTLVKTSAAFSVCVQEVCQTIGISLSDMDKIIFGLRQEFIVNPVILKVALSLAANLVNASPDTVQQGIARIDQLYLSDRIPAYPGAVEVVDMFNTAGFYTMVATHALSEWDFHKNVTAGLVGKFAETRCFDVTYPKSSQWSNFFAHLKFSPQQCVVIGDNLAADLLVPSTLGALTIHVKNGRMSGYNPEKSHFLMQPTISVDHVADLLKLNWK